jgi:hypothetical protein
MALYIKPIRPTDGYVRQTNCLSKRDEETPQEWCILLKTNNDVFITYKLD